MKHKRAYAFVGTDTEGDSCIYVISVDADGKTGDYLRGELLEKIADKINSMKIGLGDKGKAA